MSKSYLENYSFYDFFVSVEKKNRKDERDKSCATLEGSTKVRKRKKERGGREEGRKSE